MANFSTSPGVTLNETDNSFISPTPVKVGAAVVGPTVKGPVEIPTIVTSYSDYKNRFGGSLISGSDTYSYLTSISAYNYFNNGGESLLVTRVVSGSYTPATSSIENEITAVTGNTASITIDVTSEAFAYPNSIQIEADSNLFVIIPNETFTNFNSSTDIYFSSSATANDDIDSYMAVVVSTINDSASDFPTLGITASYASGTNELTVEAINGGTSLNGVLVKSGYYTNPGTTIGTLTGGTANESGDAFVLETLSEGVIMNNSSSLNSDGSLPNGTDDNVRWEITNRNTGSGTFNVLIRQGDDNTNNKNILETFTNVNLDPNSPRYVSKVIGDQVISYNSTDNQVDITSGTYPNISRYVRVKEVAYKTPNYLDNTGTAKSEFTSSIPVNGAGPFDGATGDVKDGANFYEAINASNTQGLVSDNYTNMISLLANSNDYQFNTLLTPGLINEFHTSPITSAITNTQLRGDSIYVIDTVGYNGTLADAVNQAQTRDNSYAATYWPWLRIQDPETSKNVWVPASTMIGGVYAHTDKVSAPWFAPAGINRGGLGSVLRAKNKLSQANRDELYANNVNPIATFPKKGIVVFGQKTLQKDASALDRVNVRRLLIELKSFIGQTADNIVFEQNTITTRNKFLAQVNPYLESIKQKQGLYAFKVIMDDSLNTPDVIDRNQLVGQIYIQPTRTAEFINLDFILQSTGAEFPA